MLTVYNSKKVLFIICFLTQFVSVSCSHSKPDYRPGYPRPYKVLGNWYQPLPNAKGFSQKGRASWYGKKFHGRKTANGEIYNMYAMTAAHKTLPLGTWIQVKNLENGRSVKVRVNDRGPFVGDRILDLSYKAAVAIDMTGNGTARIKIKVIDTPRNKKKKRFSKQISDGIFSVQTGSFSDKVNAESFMAMLDRTYKNVHMAFENNTYKVRVGRFKNRKDAEKTKSALKNAGYVAFLVQE